LTLSVVEAKPRNGSEFSFSKQECETRKLTKRER
jgi:hypothetical protein